MGYHRAGFEIYGVDREPQPHYPFAFKQADALTIELDGFDVIHASPPCQAYSTQTKNRNKHPKYIHHIRERLRTRNVPYIIENVEGAKLYLENPVRLCGSSFGLNLRRHRFFETNFPLRKRECCHHWQTPRFRSLDMSLVKKGKLASVVGVHGHINYPGEFQLRCEAMGIDWMTNAELVEAIPPAYTEYIGKELLTWLHQR